jgi:ribonuclease HI
MQLSPPRKATVITDASFCPFKSVGAWAAWIRIDGQPDAIKQGGILPKGKVPDSTVAEVMAAGNGVWLAARAGATHILLQSDCMAVIHLIDKRAKAPRLLALWAELLGMDTLAGVQNIEARHVKGHTRTADARSYVNRWCDETARNHLRKARASNRR